MAAPVWVLSVDLQTKTATFQTGMSEAVSKARGSFGEIKDAAKEMSGSMGYSMRESRESVMAVSEMFGVHLPAAISRTVAGIGPLGPALAAALPFAALALGAVTLFEHINKLKEAAEKLATDQNNFKNAAADAFDSWDVKILQAGVKADELSGNHLEALKKQLQLIDHQTMSELMHQFGELDKVAQAVFTDLKTSWYEAGTGSEHAKNALRDFKTQFDEMRRQRNETGASAFLDETLKKEQSILDLQKQARANQNVSYSGYRGQGDRDKFIAAENELKKQGLGFDEKELQSQEALVAHYREKVDLMQRAAEFEAKEHSNATRETGNKASEEAAKQEREMWADARRAADQANKEWDKRYSQSLADLEQSERAKIAATEQGSAARLAAIDTAIKREEDLDLQETSFYRSLLTSRVELVRQMADEQANLQAEAAKEDAEHDLKMGELKIAAEKISGQSVLAAKRGNLDAQEALELGWADEEYRLKMSTFAKEIEALDKSGKDYTNKLKAIQDKELELVKEHENQVTQIKQKAEDEQTARIVAAEQKMEDEIARGLAQTLMRHESFGKMMVSIGDQIMPGMIQSALLLETVQGRKRLSDARTAAGDAYQWGWEHGGPAAPLLAPVLAAGAFAAGMAFEYGGIVPGVELGDVVAARLSPGETVLPKQMTERLNRAADDGGGQRSENHFHYRPTFHLHAIDATGVERMLEKHTDKFSKHFQGEMRRMNR